MREYNKVAICHLLEDANQKDYAFALFDNDWILTVDSVKDNYYAVVAVGKTNRLVIAKVVKVIDKREYTGCPITKEVVTYFNTNDYDARQEADKELKMLTNEAYAKEFEIQKHILHCERLKNFEENARKYSSVDPEIGYLLDELKILNNKIERNKKEKF